MYGVKRQKEHTHIDARILDFTKVHFGDASYNGFVWLGTKQCKNYVINGKSRFDKGFQDMKAVRISELPNFLREMHVSEFGNYYITANVMTSNARRCMDTAFTINNIVIDIDCHDEKLLWNRAYQTREVIRQLNAELFEDGIIPHPNSIVYTGRGIQLWWSLQPQLIKRDRSKAKILKIYKTVKRVWSDLIEGALLHNFATIYFTVDRAATNNVVGYFRMPYTRNLSCDLDVWTRVRVFHNAHFDCFELYDRNYPVKFTDESLMEIKRMAYNGVPTYAFSDSEEDLISGMTSAVAMRRVMAMIHLRRLRNAPVDEETRDLYIWVLYSAFRFGGLSDAEALSRVSRFNCEFKNPLSEKEIDSCLDASAERGGYKMSNETIIEKLCITKKEQAEIKLTAATGREEARERLSAAQAIQRERRTMKYARVIALHRLGKNNSEIARKTGLTRPTVIKYVRLYEEYALPPEIVRVSTMYLERWQMEAAGYGPDEDDVDTYSDEEWEWMQAAGIEVDHSFYGNKYAPKPAETPAAEMPAEAALATPGEAEATTSSASPSSVATVAGSPLSAFSGAFGAAGWSAALPYGWLPRPRPKPSGWALTTIKNGPIEKTFNKPVFARRSMRKKRRFEKPPRTS